MFKYYMNELQGFKIITVIKSFKKAIPVTGRGCS
jgi:hypothetical protein